MIRTQSRLKIPSYLPNAPALKQFLTETQLLYLPSRSIVLNREQKLSDHYCLMTPSLYYHTNWTLYEEIWQKTVTDIYLKLLFISIQIKRHYHNKNIFVTQCFTVIIFFSSVRDSIGFFFNETSKLQYRKINRRKITNSWISTPTFATFSDSC